MRQHGVIGSKRFSGRRGLAAGDSDGRVSCRAAGSNNENSVPPAIRGVIQIFPPWFSIVDLQIAKPIPNPSDLVVKNWSKMQLRSSAGMPSPVSAIVTCTIAVVVDARFDGDCFRTSRIVGGRVDAVEQ